MKASDTWTKWSHVSNKSNVSQENNIFVKIIRDNRDLFCEFVTAGSNDSLETDVLPDPLKNEKFQSILKKDQEIITKLLEFCRINLDYLSDAFMIIFITKLSKFQLWIYDSLHHFDKKRLSSNVDLGQVTS